MPFFENTSSIPLPVSADAFGNLPHPAAAGLPFGAAQAYLLCGQHLRLPAPALRQDDVLYEPGPVPLFHRPGGSERQRIGDGRAHRPAGSGHPPHDRFPRRDGHQGRPAQAGAVYAQLPVHDDVHLLHLRRHCRHAGGPGPAGGAVGVSAPEKRPPLPPLPLSPNQRGHQHPRLPGQEAVCEALPGGPENL